MTGRQGIGIAPYSDREPHPTRPLGGCEHPRNRVTITRRNGGQGYRCNACGHEDVNEP